MARPIFASSDTGYFLFVALVTLLRRPFGRGASPHQAGTRLGSDSQERANGGRGRRQIVFYKAWAFALSGFLAGVAGALLAGLFGQLDASAFPTTSSIVIFIGTLLGGYQVWLGSFLGGILTRFVPALLIDLNVNTNVGFIIFGAALLFALRDPLGVGGQLTLLAERLYKKYQAQRAS